MKSSERESKLPTTTQRSLPIVLLRAREAVMEKFRPMLAAHDVTEQQWRVLRVIGESEPVEAGLVAKQSCVLPPSLSRIIKALEASGLLKSARDKSDGRRTLLALTVRGRGLLVSAAPESADIYAAIEMAFGKHEVQRLLDDLEKLQRALDR